MVDTRTKRCPNCSGNLGERDIAFEALISDHQQGAYCVPCIDGRALTQRYATPVRRFMRIDITPLVPALKHEQIFSGSKILSGRLV